MLATLAMSGYDVLAKLACTDIVRPQKKPMSSIIKQQSFLASLIHSAVWKSAAKGASLVKHIVIAAAIGLSAQLDVYYMALAIFGLLVEIWGLTLRVLAVPFLVRISNRKFGKAATGIILLSLLASLLLAAAFLLMRDQLSHFAIGFDAEKKQFLSNSFVWLAPFLVLHVPASAIGSALRAKRLFSPVYQAEALNAVVILGCVAFAPLHPTVLFWSLSCGTTASFIYLSVCYISLVGIGANLMPKVDSSVLNLIKTAPGLLLLNGTYIVFLTLDRIFASFIPVEGAISALAYAIVIAGMLPSLVNVEGAFITVAAEKSSRAERSESTNNLFSMIILLSVGSTAFLLVAGQDAIALLLERGAFSSADTRSVGLALTCFAFMIAPIFALGPIDNVFQIEQRIGFMVRRTLMGVALGIALNYVAIFVLKWGIFGLAMATTVSYWYILIAGIIFPLRCSVPRRCAPANSFIK